MFNMIVDTDLNFLADKTLIVMPTFNEAGNIENMIESVFKVIPNIHILVVDDDSPDGTSDIVSEMMYHYRSLHLLTKVKDKGFAKAYISGFRWALDNGFERVIQMDADGSHQPVFLPSMIEASRDADYVIGSRWMRGGQVVNWPFSRLILSKGGNWYARFMLHPGVKDATGGFKLIKADLLKRMRTDEMVSKGYSFQIELLLRAVDAGAVKEEIPIVFVEREVGVSKMSRKIIIEAMMYVTKTGIKRFFGLGKGK